MLLHANISDTPFDQKSPGPPEVGVWNCHRQTDGHRDSLTESVQLANSVKSIVQFTYIELQNMIQW